MFPASAGHTCVFLQCTHSARTVHAQCTATVHGLETLQIPQKMAPRLQNIEKTGCRIFFWFHAISTDDVLFTPFPARALRRALCVHCQNTRTRPAPPSCSEPWCCAVLAAAVCLLVSLCARSWNTIVSLKGPCSISRYLQIFWEYRLQKSCLLVFWLSCSVAWNACRICMFACKSVCMYVCMYVRTCWNIDLR